MNAPRFYFSTCQVGADKAVKAEVLARHPSLRFAFSRPGFITFKESDERRPPIARFEGVFVRLWGSSPNTKVARAGDETARDLLDAVPPAALIHAFERDTFVPGDEPPGFVWNERSPRSSMPCPPTSARAIAGTRRPGPERASTT